MGNWVFGYLSIWIFGYFGIWVFGYLGILCIWVFGYLGIVEFWNFGILEFWDLGIQGFRNFGFWENWKKNPKVVFDFVRCESEKRNKYVQCTDPQRCRLHSPLDITRRTTRKEAD